MVTIYGGPRCEWCKRAVALAQNYQLEYEYFSVDVPEYKAKLKELKPDTKTIPQIWWHERHIGGHDEFAFEIENTIGGEGEQPL